MLEDILVLITLRGSDIVDNNNLFAPERKKSGRAVLGAEEGTGFPRRDDCDRGDLARDLGGPRAHFFAFSPSSTRRRMALARAGLSASFFRQ